MTAPSWTNRTMPQESTTAAAPAHEPGPGYRREQIGWYFYDWANSAFSATVATVFLSPYISNLARAAAGPDELARFFGIPVAPDSIRQLIFTLGCTQVHDRFDSQLHIC
ncbi:MAG: MFS transporter [Caldilineaceae bacterium]|nr:MFS transporter [Caldilineaceae bacterium]MDE0463740.1 MFS transporter [Caldilineaceae bacterium]